MNILFFTTPTCVLCKGKTALLKERGIEFKEVVLSDDTQDLFDKYNVRAAGILVDSDTGKHLEFNKVLQGGE